MHTIQTINTHIKFIFTMTPKQQTTEATGARKGPVNATAGRTP